MKIKILLIVLALGCSSVSIADAITDQLEAALKAYNTGDHRGAMNELKFATADLQQKINNENKQVLPEALTGWTASEAEATSMGAGMMGMMGGTQMKRSYTNVTSGETIEIEIIADSPMIQVMGMMFSNPMMIQSDPDMSSFRHGSMRGIMKHESNSQDWEASLMLAGRILVQVRGSRLKDDSAIKAYLDALDLKKVETAFANQ